MKMPRVITFGETMLRLCPPGYLRLLQATSLDVTFGGAEANVAVSLALLGLDAAYVTRLPENDIAQLFVNQIRGLGVDTSLIQYGGDRMGVYYVEQGASQRASTVTYDRKHSAIAELDPASLDWDKILDGAAAFHVTGITPALSSACVTATLDAVKAARAKGVFVSCDLNYRKKLWSKEKSGKVMRDIWPYVNLCFAGEGDAEIMLEDAEFGKGLEGIVGDDRCVAVAEKLIERFDFKGIGMSRRVSHSASHNGWSGMFYWEGKPYFSPDYELSIVDRVGGGDSFDAGLLYALLTKRSPQETIDFAVAASCLKHTVVGDFNYIKLSEIEALVAGDGSGRVQR